MKFLKNKRCEDVVEGSVSRDRVSPREDDIRREKEWEFLLNREGKFLMEDGPSSLVFYDSAKFPFLSSNSASA